MAEVALIDIGYRKIENFLAFLWLAPVLNPDLKTGPTSVKVERAGLLRSEKSISVASAILISIVQLCPTSSSKKSYRVTIHFCHSIM